MRAKIQLLFQRNALILRFFSIFVFNAANGTAGAFGGGMAAVMPPVESGPVPGERENRVEEKNIK